ncbi:glycosyltransferase family 92 protein [Mesorhizobium caraganae]|uniref:Glycosyltransferase family 92 protein n=1 Tax=Mesorhizobium caraganae TaxID=483206 RepID=A0ABV1Z3D1_9HYPH
MRIPFSVKRPVICAIMKLEQPYVIEWVAWHKLHGFDLMIANNCTAGPQTAVLSALRDAGWIRLVDWRHDTVLPQRRAYSYLYWQALLHGYRYLGFMDADEFLEPLDGPPWSGAELVRSLLSRPGVRSVAFRWVNFGSDGKEAYDDELVTVRFQRRGTHDAPTARWKKSFARVSSVLRKALRDPKQFMPHPHGFRISLRRTLVDGMTLDKHPAAMPMEWKTGWIRHYAVKSKQELADKHARGGGFTPASEAPSLEEYRASRDQNDILDPLDDATVAALRAKVAEIVGSLDPAVIDQTRPLFGQRG